VKSLAHPEWPYAGTAHEWRGFVKDDGKEKPVKINGGTSVYQKQNFGPKLD
jgi:hypothetical protein